MKGFLEKEAQSKKKRSQLKELSPLILNPLGKLTPLVEMMDLLKSQQLMKKIRQRSQLLKRRTKQRSQLFQKRQNLRSQQSKRLNLKSLL